LPLNNNPSAKIDGFATEQHTLRLNS